MSRIGHPVSPQHPVRFTANTPVTRQQAQNITPQGTTEVQPSTPQFAGKARKGAATLGLALLASLGFASPAFADHKDDHSWGDGNGNDQGNHSTPPPQPSPRTDYDDSGLRAQIADLQQKVSALDSENDQLEQRLEAEEGKSGSIDQKINGFDQRLGAQEAVTKGLQEDVKNLDGRISSFNTTLEGLSTSVGGLKTQVNELSGKAGTQVDALATRLTSIETVVNTAVKAGGLVTQNDLAEIKTQQESFSGLIQNLVEEGKISQEEAESVENPLVEQVSNLETGYNELVQAVNTLNQRLGENAAVSSPSEGETTDAPATPAPLDPITPTDNPGNGDDDNLILILALLSLPVSSIALFISMRNNRKLSSQLSQGSAGPASASGPKPPEPPPSFSPQGPVKPARGKRKAPVEETMTIEDLMAQPARTQPAVTGTLPQAALPAGKTPAELSEAVTEELPAIPAVTETAQEPGKAVEKPTPNSREVVQKNAPTPKAAQSRQTEGDDDEDLQIPPFLLRPE